MPPVKQTWSNVKLGEVCQVIPGYAFKSGDWQEKGIPVIKIKNIRGDRSVDTTEVDRVPEEILTLKIKKYILNDGDYLIAMTGATAGKVGRLRTNEVILLNQRVAKIKPINGNSLFIWSVISSKDYEKLFFNLADGAAQPNMSGSQIEGVEIPFPDIDIQNKIAAILSTYDDLIENNLRRIKILEEMAQLLYQEWFVKFRFPGQEKVKMVNSPLGKIPEGWEPKTIGDVAEDKRRSVKPEEIPPDTPYMGLEHLPRKSIALSEWGFANEIESMKFEFKRGEILFCKIRPYFHKVGFAPISGICSSDAIVIDSKAPKWYPPLLFCVSSEDFVAHATQTSNGTKMPRADWNVLKKFPFPLPPEPLLNQFNSIARPNLDFIENLIHKNNNLRQTRDLLLPKLISGELDVSDLDIAIPEEDE